MTLKERTMTMLRIFLHSLVKIDIYIYTNTSYPYPTRHVMAKITAITQSTDLHASALLILHLTLV